MSAEWRTGVAAEISMCPILPALLDALSFVLIFPHISATISEEAHRRVLLPCHSGIIENFCERENTRKS